MLEPQHAKSSVCLLSRHLCILQLYLSLCKKDLVPAKMLPGSLNKGSSASMFVSLEGVSFLKKEKKKIRREGEVEKRNALFTSLDN